MAVSYNKLVRDRIPDRIEASGKACVTEILPDEELAEYHKDQNIKED